jgi:hypothetical protein
MSLSTVPNQTAPAVARKALTGNPSSSAVAIPYLHATLIQASLQWFCIWAVREKDGHRRTMGVAGLF